MNRLLILILLFCLSCSGQPTSRQAQFIQTPVLYPVGNYLNKTYDEAFFKEDHFNYASNVQGADTTKYFYTSETTIIEDTVRRFLRNCEAVLNNDSLFLQLNDIHFLPVHTN